MKGYYVITGYKCFVHLSRFWIPISLSWEDISLILSRAKKLKWKVKSLPGAYITVIYIHPGDNMKRIVFQFYKTGILIQAKGFILKDILDKLKLVLGRRIRADQVEVITVELYTLIRHPLGINHLKDFAKFFDLELKEIVFSSGRARIKKGYYILIDGDKVGLPGASIYLKARTHDPLPKTIDEPPYPDLQDKIEIVVTKKPFTDKLRDTFSRIISRIKSIFRALLGYIVGKRKEKILRRALYLSLMDKLDREDFEFLRNIPPGWFKLSDIRNIDRATKRRVIQKLVKLGIVRKLWHWYRLNNGYYVLSFYAAFGKSFSDRAILKKEAISGNLSEIERYLIGRLLENLEKRKEELSQVSNKNNNNNDHNRRDHKAYINYLILGLKRILGLLQDAYVCLKSKCLKKVWNGTKNSFFGISHIKNRDNHRDIPEILNAYDLYLAYKRNPFLRRLYKKRWPGLLLILRKNREDDNDERE